MQENVLTKKGKKQALIDKRLSELKTNIMSSPCPLTIIVSFINGHKRTTRQIEENDSLATCLRGFCEEDQDSIVSTDIVVLNA